MVYFGGMLLHTVATLGVAYWSFARTRQGFLSKTAAFLVPPVLIVVVFWLVFA